MAAYYTMRETMTPESPIQVWPAPEIEPAPPVPEYPTLRLGKVERAVIIYNPAAGRRRHLRARHLQQARQILEECEIHAELRPTTSPGGATQQAREAVAQGADLVIASGGDGTVNEVVNGMAGSRVPLGVLPAGTANVLAKELGLPWDVRAAARQMAGATLRRIALGRVVLDAAPEAPRYFVALAGAGTDGVMVYSVHQPLKKRTGQLAYWIAGLLLPFRYRFPYLRMQSEEHAASGSLIAVGRARHYGGPAMITTEADLFDDYFEVGAFEVGFWGGMRLLPAVLRGTLHGKRGVRFWKTQRVRCEPMGPEPICVQVDGEYFGKLPAEFSIVPDALTLVIPRAATKRS